MAMSTEQLTIKKESLVRQLTIAYATYEEALAKLTSKYRLDSGQGSQMVERHSPAVLRKEIEYLELQLSEVEEQLDPSQGGGLMRLV